MSGERVALFVLKQLHRKFANGWLGGPIPSHSNPSGSGRILSTLAENGISLTRSGGKKLTRVDSFTELCQSYFLRTVREDSRRALVAWLEDRYPLTLLESIPTPLEMLDAQCEGRRFVTLLEKPEDWERPIGRHAGSLEFLLHDLEHADKFFGDRDLYRGQLKFFRKLRMSLASFSTLRKDPQFAHDIDYAMADMNSHPLHLFKYLKAVVLMHYLRSCHKQANESLPAAVQNELDSFWCELFRSWRMSDLEVEAGLRINRPQIEQPEDGLILSQFFMKDEG